MSVKNTTMLQQQSDVTVIEVMGHVESLIDKMNTPQRKEF